MRAEWKIALPIYKIIYAACFIVILSLIRGVTYSSEIGIALESPMAILALVFCADTYVMEIINKRSEVNRLYPMRKRVFSQYRRMIIQIIFLLILSIFGYGFFWIFQQPTSGIPANNVGIMLEPKSEGYLLLTYIISMIVTISLWGSLSNTIACLYRNMWGGIGCSILLWLGANSKTGDKLLGKWNFFSYTFRNIENRNDYSWLCGKGLCVGLIILFVIFLPIILKKRG